MTIYPDRKWTIHLIHHSHTDIGYTESQSRIARYHVHFIDRVLEMARRRREGDTSLAGFRWTSECFWSIEEWLKVRSERTDELVQAIQEGVIALSGTYLHFTELIDEHSLRVALAKGRKFADTHGLKLDAGLSADINGFSWGYSQVLHDAGIHNLMTCVHTVHGMAPIGKRQLPFFWETPSGDEILVWNGEHYMLGNTLGLAPRAMISCPFTDELQPTPHTPNHWFHAETRLPRYLKKFEEKSYPYDFVAIGVGGALTDNAPPAEGIIHFIEAWNKKHGERIRIEMSSPSEFCAKVRAQTAPIPRYRGDWPDWWSDGFVSLPSETRLVREAQRNYHWLRGLHDRGIASLAETDRSRIDQAIRLYCEHTFQHSDSIVAPWELSAKAIGGNKRAMAYEAFDAVMDARDAAFAALGERAEDVTDAEEAVFHYRVLNPSDAMVTEVARLYLEYRDWDTIEQVPGVILADSKNPLLVQQGNAPRGFAFHVPLTLGPRESVLLELRERPMTLDYSERNASDGARVIALRDDVCGAEAATPKDVMVTERLVETPYLRLTIESGRGITSWFDKTAGRELLSPQAAHAPFAPVYEVTPVTPTGNGPAQVQARNQMGRNRKGANVQRSCGELRGVKVISDGPVFAEIVLDYAVEGVPFFNVTLRVALTESRVDAFIRIHKASIWEPENLYIALPFQVAGGQYYLDKPGAIVRPRVDQLPDTLTDWSCLQEGYAISDGEFGIAVATPDAPLLQLGPLEHGKRLLMGHPELSGNPAEAWSWVMTNYWETNFEASLGGFYEFIYRVASGPKLADPAAAIQLCRSMNVGLKTFRVDES